MRSPWAFAKRKNRSFGQYADNIHSYRPSKISDVIKILKIKCYCWIRISKSEHYYTVKFDVSITLIVKFTLYVTVLVRLNRPCVSGTQQLNNPVTHTHKHEPGFRLLKVL